MPVRIPSDRQLPHAHDLLDRVLAGRTPLSRSRLHGWPVPVAAAAAVALVGGSVVVWNQLGDREVTQPAATPTVTKAGVAPSSPKPAPADHSIQLNVGTVEQSEAKKLAKACIKGLDGKLGEIGHLVRVKAWGPKETKPSLTVVNNKNKLTYGCAGFPTANRGGTTVPGYTVGLVGGDPADAAKIHEAMPPTDATHPAVPTSFGSGPGGVGFDNETDPVVVSSWFRVDERVASMRQRIVVKDKPGPWYVADAVAGTVYVASWDNSTAIRKGDVVKVETQVLDAQGNLLDAPARIMSGGKLTPSPGTTSVEIFDAIDEQFSNDPVDGVLWPRDVKPGEG